MKEVIFKVFSLVLGSCFLVYGFSGLLDFQRNSVRNQKFFFNAPVITLKAVKSEENPLKSEWYDSYFYEKKDIVEIENQVFEVGSFSSFQKYSQEYWKGSPTKPEIMVYRASFLGKEHVSFATARDQQVVLFYRPKLLILVLGYGEDETFLELEKNQYTILRGVEYSRQRVEETATVFRTLGVPYCIITYVPTPPASLTSILQTALFPSQWLLNKKKTTISPTGNDPLTRNLQIKKSLYDSILKAIDKGAAILQLDANYLDIETVNSLLESISPLPVALTDQLFWVEQELNFPSVS